LPVCSRRSHYNIFQSAGNDKVKNAQVIADIDGDAMHRNHFLIECPQRRFFLCRPTGRANPFAMGNDAKRVEQFKAKLFESGGQIRHVELKCFEFDNRVNTSCPGLWQWSAAAANGDNIDAFGV